MGRKTTNKASWHETFRKVCKRTFKLDPTAFKQLGSICENDVKVTELKAGLGEKNLNEAFESLDGDLDKKINVDFDPIQLLQNIDANSDYQIEQSEFMTHFEHTLYSLVLEDVLTNPITTLSQRPTTSPITALFPLQNSTINEDHISALLRKFDLDNSNIVTRAELSQTFQNHKHMLA
jgi:hypothetical protein